MLTHRIALGLMALIAGTISPASAEDTWKVTNRGGGTYVVRLRPASNRKVGFAVSQAVKPGETKTIPLAYQGSFDINIQFLDKDGSVKNSWTADQPIDLRKRPSSPAGDNLIAYAMSEPTRVGPDGKTMYTLKWTPPRLVGMELRESTKELYELGAVNIQDPKSPKLVFEGGVTVGEKILNFQASGTPSEPVLAIDGEVYKIADLVIFRSPQEGRATLSGTYSGGGQAGEFLLERRESFPFPRLNLDLKAQGASDWSSFRLGAMAAAKEVKGGVGVQIDEVRDVVFELQQPLKDGQMRVEQRLAGMEARLNGRLAEVELRLGDPKVFRIMKTCVNCHRDEPAPKAPRSLPSLLTAIPRMSEATTKDMIKRSELDEQDRARYLDYAKELAKTFGP